VNNSFEEFLKKSLTATVPNPDLPQVTMEDLEKCVIDLTDSVDNVWKEIFKKCDIDWNNQIMYLNPEYCIMPLPTGKRVIHSSYVNGYIVIDRPKPGFMPFSPHLW